MKATERRKEIAVVLMSVNVPVSGDDLARRLSVSRQTIVQDIVKLKNDGFDIISTHSGYLLKRSPLFEREFKLYHTTEDTEDELCTIVDFGGTVVDVYVWHKIYGKISAPLNIFSRNGIKEFISGVRSGKSTELMSITGGYHYHTVRAPSEEILDKIENALKEKNYIASEI
jgi:transcriptional regulator of NAD metabolism